MHAVRLQRLYVFLHCWMGKHIQVHCRSNENWAFGRKVRCEQQIVGYSVCHLSDGVGCSRSNKVCICPHSKAYVRIPFAVFRIEEIDVNRILRQRCECQRSNKLFCQRSHHNLDFGSLRNEQTDDVRSLVCRDTSSNAKQYVFSAKHRDIIQRFRP